ncbi:MAG: 4Fe-4S single cluster domain-containing protein [Polyangiaceae bacterium]
MAEPATLQVAQVVADTDAEGPGRRFAIWLQGCPLRCPGCCNPDMLPFEGGEPMEVVELLAAIEATSDIDGITLLGGEPFAQARPAAVLCEAVQARGLGVMIFSGFTREELERRGDDDRRLLAACDLLVDGRYDRRLPDRERRFVGSTNQRLHFLTPRYRSDARLGGRNSVELRLTREGLTINGWPDAASRIGRP